MPTGQEFYFDYNKDGSSRLSLSDLRQSIDDAAAAATTALNDAKAFTTTQLNSAEQELQTYADNAADTAKSNAQAYASNLVKQLADNRVQATEDSIEVLRVSCQMSTLRSTEE